MQLLEKTLNFFGLQKKGISNSTSNASGGDPFILAGGYKKIAKDIMSRVLNAVLAKCNIEALILSQEVNLPPPIPLPKVTMTSNEKQE